MFIRNWLSNPSEHLRGASYSLGGVSLLGREGVEARKACATVLQTAVRTEKPEPKRDFTGPMVGRPALVCHLGSRLDDRSEFSESSVGFLPAASRVLWG